MKVCVKKPSGGRNSPTHHENASEDGSLIVQYQELTDNLGRIPAGVDIAVEGSGNDLFVKFLVPGLLADLLKGVLLDDQQRKHDAFPDSYRFPGDEFVLHQF